MDLYFSRVSPLDGDTRFLICEKNDFYKRLEVADSFPIGVSGDSCPAGAP